MNETKRNMTQKEFNQDFKTNILPSVIARCGKNDKPAIREAYNNYSDSLCKDGLITTKQYNNWCTPNSFLK